MGSMVLGRRMIGVVLLGWVCGAAGMIRAELPQSLIQQRFPLKGRLEIMLTPAVSVLDKYTRHAATSLGVGYYFHEFLGLEVDSGYAFYSGNRALLDDLLATAGENLRGIERLPLRDLKRLTWFAQMGVNLVPLYGKVNLASQLAVLFHLYLVAGAGVAQFHYTELRWAESVSRQVEVDLGVSPTFYYGGGIRLYLSPHLSLRAELRNLAYHDTYTAQKITVVVQDGTNPAPKEKSIDDLVNITFARLGLCYAF